MKFVIYREVEADKRVHLLEWDKDDIIFQIWQKMKTHVDIQTEPVLRKAFYEVVEDFKKKTISIP